VEAGREAVAPPKASGHRPLGRRTPPAYRVWTMSCAADRRCAVG
jgi:hypothetical protein